MTVALRIIQVDKFLMSFFNISISYVDELFKYKRVVNGIVHHCCVVLIQTLSAKVKMTKDTKFITTLN